MKENKKVFFWKYVNSQIKWIYMLNPQRKEVLDMTNEMKEIFKAIIGCFLAAMMTYGFICAIYYG